MLVSSHLSACPLLRERAALKYLPINPPKRKSLLYNGCCDQKMTAGVCHYFLGLNLVIIDGEEPGNR